jgi:hypothetical protein
MIIEPGTTSNKTKAVNGFARTDAGLLVPFESALKREVWTKAEFQQLNRLGKLLKTRGMTFSIACAAESCQGKPMAFAQRPGGGTSLRCQCKDRIFGQQGV